MSDEGSFPALDRLKRDAEGMEVLVEAAPQGTTAAIEWLLGLDYLDRKRELLETRRAVREEYRRHVQRIEQAYGTPIVQACNREADGDQPAFQPRRVLVELNDARAVLDDLDDSVDHDFLTGQERRKQSQLETDLKNARGYIRNKVAFNEQRTAIQQDIEAFDELFEPYAGCETYMISSDQEALIERADAIWRQLAAMTRELELPTLPDTDADWLAEQKTRFGEYTDQLPRYNEEFVAQERDTYAELFETDHGPLNEQQQKAVVRDDRRNLVDASAGTGKTLTLTYRFVYLLEKGVSPSNIAAITHTTDAADEMKTRIAEATSVKESRLNISTFHKFATRICLDAEGGNLDSLGEARRQLIESYVAAAEAENTGDTADVAYPKQYQQFREAHASFKQVAQDHDPNIIEKQQRRTESRTDFFVRKYTKFVKKARTFDVSSETITARLDGSHELRDVFGEAGAALVEAYDRTLEDHTGPADFADMIYTATEIVEANPERFGSQFSHLLVDEFQDVSDATLQFIEAFMGGGSETHMFCVGDDWQSIFGFSGSDVTYFTGYDTEFEDVTSTQLEVNYRCPQSIVDAGSKLMAKSSAAQNDKHVTAVSDVRTTPQLHTLEELYDDRVVPYVADLVEAKLETHTPDEVMVLSRNDEKGKYMSALRDELEERAIPHLRPDGIKDHLPDGYRDELEFPVGYDDEGTAEYEIPRGSEESAASPPLVRTQSIHASKGTEAPVVILLHTVDDDPHGIPIEERGDPLIEPALEVTADHIPEERRLFYVALTRAEAEFHAVGRRSKLSRYVEDIADHFERRDAPLPDELVGRCTNYSPSRRENDPIKATLSCSAFDVSLLSWPNQDPPPLEEGATYRIEINQPERQINRSKYGDEIRFDRTPMTRLDDGSGG